MVTHIQKFLYSTFMNEKSHHIPYCRDAMHGVSAMDYFTSINIRYNVQCKIQYIKNAETAADSRDAMHGVSTLKIMHRYRGNAIYVIHTMNQQCRDAMHRVSTDRDPETNYAILPDKNTNNT